MAAPKPIPFASSSNLEQFEGRHFGAPLGRLKRDWGGLYANHTMAKRIIELAKGGERNPDVLCEQALSYFLRD